MEKLITLYERTLDFDPSFYAMPDHVIDNAIKESKSYLLHGLYFTNSLLYCVEYDDISIIDKPVKFYIRLSLFGGIKTFDNYGTILRISKRGSLGNTKESNLGVYRMFDTKEECLKNKLRDN